MAEARGDEVAALKELFALRMDHLEEKLEEHAKQSSHNYEEIQKQFTRAREEIHRDQQLLAERTVESGNVLKEKLQEMNQFRAQLEQERNLYVTRDRLDAATESQSRERESGMQSVNIRMDELSNRMNEAEKAKANLDGRFSLLGMILVGLSVLLQAVFTYISRAFK